MGNRVIKFRGKRVDNGEWVYGYYQELVDNENHYYWVNEPNGDITDVIPETVGQYAGLYDKNRVEIYEGDIVHLPQHNHSGRVFFNVNHGWVVEGICMSVKVHNYKNIEVIGNIHEHNLELIEEMGNKKEE